MSVYLGPPELGQLLLSILSGLVVGGQCSAEDVARTLADLGAQAAQVQQFLEAAHGAKEAAAQVVPAQ